MRDLNDYYVLPLYAQSQGFYSAYVRTKSNAENDIVTFDNYLRISNKNKKAIGKNFFESEGRADINVRSEIYIDDGAGFLTRNVYPIYYKTSLMRERIRIEFQLPKGKINRIRFNPCEGFMCLCSEISCNLPNATIYNYNGKRFGNEDIFFTKDPQFVIEGEFDKVNKLVINMENISLFWNQNGLDKEFKAYEQEHVKLIEAFDYYSKESQKYYQEREALKSQLDSVNGSNASLIQEIEQMKNSRSWRYTSWLRRKS